MLTILASFRPAATTCPLTSGGWQMYLLLALSAILIIYGFLSDRANARKLGMFRAIIDSFNAPVLFYDNRDKLAFANSQAETVFGAIKSEIRSYAYIRTTAQPDGPGFYLTDTFGNGYRLEIMKREYSRGAGGHIVIVKGHAKVH